MTQPNLSIMKIEAYHCYSCSNPFGKTGKHRKTQHHAIPQFLKPKRNVLVPVCYDCHKNINKYLVQSIPKLDALTNFIGGMEKFIKKYKKVVEKYKDKDEDDEEEEEK